MKLVKESLNFQRGQKAEDTLKIGDWKGRKFEQQLKEFDGMAISNGFIKSDELDEPIDLVTYKKNSDIVSVFIDETPVGEDLMISIINDDTGMDIEVDFDEMFRDESWDYYFDGDITPSYGY